MNQHLRCSSCLTCLMVALLLPDALAQTTATAPTTGLILPEGPLTATITGVEGMVSVKPAPGEAWQKAAVGMVLNEGAEFRTGPRSVIQCVIPPDQVVTLDRLGTLQLLRANLEDGKLVTDLGMKYGRTRYDIEAAGREYDAKVRSPNSVLAVRGTRVYLYDQPPFAPQAVSFRGRTRFSDSDKDVPLGNQSFSRITTETESAAQASLWETYNDARSDFAGRTVTDTLLGLTLGPSSGPDYQSFATISQRSSGAAVSAGLPTGPALILRDLSFALSWFGTPFSDVQLTVTNAIGQTLSMSNPVIAGVGSFDVQGAIPPNGQGFGFQEIIFGPSHLPGTYTVRMDFLNTGRADSADATVQAIDNIGPDPPPIATINATLNPTSPTFTDTVNVTGQPPTQPRRARTRR